MYYIFTICTISLLYIYYISTIYLLYIYYIFTIYLLYINNKPEFFNSIIIAPLAEKCTYLPPPPHPPRLKLGLTSKSSKSNTFSLKVTR